jgi:hypothetical protein
MKQRRFGVLIKAGQRAVIAYTEALGICERARAATDSGTEHRAQQAGASAANRRAAALQATEVWREETGQPTACAGAVQRIGRRTGASGPYGVFLFICYVERFNWA